MSKVMRYIFATMWLVCGAVWPCTAQAMPDSTPAEKSNVHTDRSSTHTEKSTTPAEKSDSVQVDTVARETFLLYYSHDDIVIDPQYLNNTHHIARIKDIFLRSPKIDSVTIYAYASPEGAPGRNQWLSERRAEAAKAFVLENLPHDSVLQEDHIYLRPMGENWEGLEREVEANYHQPNRDRVLNILRADIPTETKKWRLKRLDGSKTYRYLIDHHMPTLRKATWVCVYVSTPELSKSKTVYDNLLERLNQTQTDADPNKAQDMAFVMQEMKSYAQKDPDLSLSALPQLSLSALTEAAEWLQARRTILALKTNLLYDAVSLLNYSVEVPITKHASALIYHQFPWWRWGQADNQYCIRFLSVGAEARWWFLPQPRPATPTNRGRDCLMGHFLGVYGESGKWDFEWDRSICHQGEHWSAGLTYGYAMPLGKYLNMEFSISAGYASIAYRKFAPSGDYEILWRDPEKHGRWHYFGPTKAQVSLVIPITVKRTWKGGAR